MEFYKFCWEVFEHDLFQCISEFFLQDHLPKVILITFISLIRKFHNPQDLSDYHPICLISSVYMIISKLLVGGLKGVLDKLISDNQSMFIPNRGLHDIFLALNEVVDYAKRKINVYLSLKLILKRLSILFLGAIFFIP